MVLWFYWKVDILDLTAFPQKPFNYRCMGKKKWLDTKRKKKNCANKKIVQFAIITSCYSILKSKHLNNNQTASIINKVLEN